MNGGLTMTTLDDQLCFLLYVSSKEVIKEYTSRLKSYDLTYTGYITLLAIPLDESISIKDLGKKLFLDSGTLTPLMKKLEAQGYVSRERSQEDERVLCVTLTVAGLQLREQLQCVSEDVFAASGMDVTQAQSLHTILQQFVHALEQRPK